MPRSRCDKCAKLTATAPTSGGTSQPSIATKMSPTCYPETFIRDVVIVEEKSNGLNFNSPERRLCPPHRMAIPCQKTPGHLALHFELHIESIVWVTPALYRSHPKQHPAQQFLFLPAILLIQERMVHNLEFEILDLQFLDHSISNRCLQRLNKLRLELRRERNDSFLRLRRLLLRESLLITIYIYITKTSDHRPTGQ